MARTGVILLNLGGPDSPRAVRPFLYNLFSDRQIIKLGPSFMQRPLAWLISTMRAGKARSAYAKIGGASPILGITNAQARALEDSLKTNGDFRVYVAMRYWHPYSEDAMVQALQDKADRLLALPLYPQYSIATTGSSEAALWDAAKDYGLEYVSVRQWFDNPLYIEALADVIRKALREETVVLFSAHSLPMSFIEAGDPYADQVVETIERLVSKLQIRWRLGYQSRSGPVRWLGPSVEHMLRELAAEGSRDVLMVPVSFVSDHIETLYEIDILYRKLGEDLGLEVRRSESLNTNPLFIKALKEIVLEKMKETGWA